MQRTHTDHDVAAMQSGPHSESVRSDEEASAERRGVFENSSTAYDHAVLSRSCNSSDDAEIGGSAEAEIESNAGSCINPRDATAQADIDSSLAQHSERSRSACAAIACKQGQCAYSN